MTAPTGTTEPAKADQPAVNESQVPVPAAVLSAYRRAEQRLTAEDPGCRLTWPVLAGIGQVESGHGRAGALTSDGTTAHPILGPVLDGRGFAAIADTDGGRLDGSARWDRAVGPMQFIPSTWARWGADGNGDGRPDPGNVFDAALATARYLCAGDRDLTVPADLDQAILSYNHSADYLITVRAWIRSYANYASTAPGSAPVPAAPTVVAAGVPQPPTIRATDPAGPRPAIHRPGRRPHHPSPLLGPAHPVSPAHPASPATHRPTPAPPRPPLPPADPEPSPSGCGSDAPTAPPSPSASPAAPDPRQPTGSATPGPSAPEATVTADPAPSASGQPTASATPSGTPSPSGEPPEPTPLVSSLPVSVLAAVTLPPCPPVLPGIQPD
ncbi:lytic murein transglycosylase [Streptomyces sp. NPDC001380]|uniref:lytic transglycosylase domain-containing protein n=1 Tax=Streptomyces sp. NPDC001380 TaxID=3364566 RepID=UPI00368FC7BB